MSSHASEIWTAIHQFKVRRGLMHVIGIGGSARIDVGDLPKDIEDRLVSARLEQYDATVAAVVAGLAGFPAAIACGGTRDGVPKISMKWAYRAGGSAAFERLVGTDVVSTRSGGAAVVTQA